MRIPVGVLISDVHFALSTLKVAFECFMQAVRHAAKLGVPLYVTGDLHDSKANIRGECANMMLEALRLAKNAGVEVVILIGNHDMVNEKGEANSLNFLGAAGAVIFDRPNCVQLKKGLVAHLIPYQNDGARFVQMVRGLKPGSLVFAHQGIRGAYMGEYTVDKTSVDPRELEGYTIISGHYHRRQTIFLDTKKHATNFGLNTFNYVGSPFSTTFAEAGDSQKGFQVLYDDLSMELVPTYQRQHRIIECTTDELMGAFDMNPTDIVWFKVSGPSVELDQLSKKAIGMHHFGHQNYRLDKIPTDVETRLSKIETMSPDQMLDSLVDENEPDKKQQEFLRNLWREVMA